MRILIRYDRFIFTLVLVTSACADSTELMRRRLGAPAVRQRLSSNMEGQWTMKEIGFVQ